MSRNTSIRTIPLSLAAVLALCFGGPLGIRNLSVDSQVDRLTRLLAVQTPTQERAHEASAALSFLLEYNAAREVRQIFGDSALRRVDLAKATWSARDTIATELLALKGVAFSAEAARPSKAHEPATRGRGTPLAVTGYDWMISVSPQQDTSAIRMGDEVLHLRTDSTRQRLTVQLQGGAPAVFAIDSMFRASRVAESPAGKTAALSTGRSVGNVRLMLALDHIYGFIGGDTLRVDGWSGQLFVGKPE